MVCKQQSSCFPERSVEMRVPSPCAANGAALGNRTPCTASWRQRVAVCSVGCLCDQGSGDGQSVRLLRGRRSRQHTCSEASSANTALGDKWGSRWATETGSCLWRRLGLSTSIYPGVVWWWWWQWSCDLRAATARCVWPPSRSRTPATQRA